jgi:hypothetical protein
MPGYYHTIPAGRIFVKLLPRQFLPGYDHSVPTGQTSLTPTPEEPIQISRHAIFNQDLRTFEQPMASRSRLVTAYYPQNEHVACH